MAVNTQAASVYAYQQNQAQAHGSGGQNHLNRSYEGNQIQPKLHSAMGHHQTSQSSAGN